MKRTLDIVFAFLGLLLFSPLFLLIALFLIPATGGSILFVQERVGKGGKTFRLFKFRTMRREAAAKGLLSLGKADDRITTVGRFLRRYKLDELPQLLNVLKGEMSIVGPRPEVEKYVLLYNEEQRKVLQVKPGLTDWASLNYFDEDEILGAAKDPEKEYVERILPQKLALGVKYVRERSLKVDFTIMLKTVQQILRQ